MTQDSQEQRFLERAKTDLDESIEFMDAPTLSRLRQARTRALERLGEKRQRRYVVPIGALATASAALLVVILWTSTPTLGPESVLDDLELLSSLDALDLYEDLEFYEWLEADAQAG